MTYLLCSIWPTMWYNICDAWLGDIYIVCDRLCDTLFVCDTCSICNICILCYILCDTCVICEIWYSPFFLYVTDYISYVTHTNSLHSFWHMCSTSMWRRYNNMLCHDIVYEIFMLQYDTIGPLHDTLGGLRDILLTDV